MIFAPYTARRKYVRAAYFDGTTQSASLIMAASGADVMLDSFNPIPDQPRLIIIDQKKGIRHVVYAGVWIIDQNGTYTSMLPQEFASTYELGPGDRDGPPADRPETV